MIIERKSIQENKAQSEKKGKRDVDLTGTNIISKSNYEVLSSVTKGASDRSHQRTEPLRLRSFEATCFRRSSLALSFF